MSVKQCVFQSVIFAQKLKSTLSIRYNDKIIASGNSSEYLCRDTAGFFWFESAQNLQIYYKSLVDICGLFITTKVGIRTFSKPFLVKKKDVTILKGEEGYTLIYYASGICYVLRKKQKNTDIFLPVNMDSSEKQVFTVCL